MRELKTAEPRDEPVGGEGRQAGDAQDVARRFAQLSERAPLLRTTALQALPPELRGAMVDRSDHVARRFAGMMTDGISEGSIRAVDPLVASQTLMAMLNAAYELHGWAAEQDADTAIATYASTITHGLFTAE